MRRFRLNGELGAVHCPGPTGVPQGCPSEVTAAPSGAFIEGRNGKLARRDTPGPSEAVGSPRFTIVNPVGASGAASEGFKRRAI